MDKNAKKFDIKELETKNMKIAIKIIENHNGKMGLQELRDDLFKISLDLGFDSGSIIIDLYRIGKIFWISKNFLLVPDDQIFYREIECTTKFLESVGGIASRQVVERHLWENEFREFQLAEMLMPSTCGMSIDVAVAKNIFLQNKDAGIIMLSSHTK